MRAKFTIFLFALLALCSFARAANEMSVTIHAKSATVDALEVRDFAVGTQLFINMPASGIYLVSVGNVSETKRVKLFLR